MELAELASCIIGKIMVTYHITLSHNQYASVSCKAKKFIIEIHCQQSSVHTTLGFDYLFTVWRFGWQICYYSCDFIARMLGIAGNNLDQNNGCISLIRMPCREGSLVYYWKGCMTIFIVKSMNIVIVLGGGGSDYSYKSCLKAINWAHCKPISKPNWSSVTNFVYFDSILS